MSAQNLVTRANIINKIKIVSCHRKKSLYNSTEQEKAVLHKYSCAFKQRRSNKFNTKRESNAHTPKEL